MLRYVLSCVLLLSLACGDAQADTTISTESAPSSISAARGLAMWSSLGADRLYRLRLYSNGIVRTVRVSPRAVPFDVNVGTDARHRTVAVYSRCRSEAADRVNAEGCSLFEYHVRTGKEQRLHGVTAHGVSAFLPAVDGGGIAYVGVRANGAQPNPQIYLVNTKTGHRSRIAGGPRGSYHLRPDGLYNGPSPVALDLSRRRVALIWRHFSPTCADSVGEFQPLTDVLLTSVGGRPQSVSSTGCSGGTTLGGLNLTSRSVLYLRHDGTDDALELYDYVASKTFVAAGYRESQSVGGSTAQVFDVRYRPETALWAVTRSTPAFEPG